MSCSVLCQIKAMAPELVCECVGVQSGRWVQNLTATSPEMLCQEE